MKLGTQTASLQNHLYSRMTNGEPIPFLGMPATILSWTDRYPATVKEVFTKGKDLYIVVRECKAKRIDSNGMSECQNYEYSEYENENDGIRATFRKNSKQGNWEQVFLNPETNRYRKYEGYGLRLGIRQKYHDYYF